MLRQRRGATGWSAAFVAAASAWPSLTLAQTPDAAPRALPAAAPFADDATAPPATTSSAPASSAPAPQTAPSGAEPSAPSPPPDGAEPVPSEAARDDLVPAKRANFIPEVLRLPNVSFLVHFSLLGRASPREQTGKLQDGGEHGFRKDTISVPIGSGGPMLGGAWGFSVTVGRRWVIPIMSIDFLQSVGSRERLLSARSGHVFEAQTWRTFQLGASLGGIGIRGSHRRFAGSVLLEPGFVMQSTQVSAVTNEDSAETNAVVFSPRVLVTAVGCRRLDPTVRLCLSFAPHVYALGFLNGFTLGFRSEIGP